MDWQVGRWVLLSTLGLTVGWYLWARLGRPMPLWLMVVLSACVVCMAVGSHIGNTNLIGVAWLAPPIAILVDQAVPTIARLRERKGQRDRKAT